MPGVAGPKRHPIEIQFPAETQDSFGAAVLTFNTVGRRWASIEPVKAKDKWDAMGYAEVSHTIGIRWFPFTGGQQSKYRIVFRGRVFEIIAVLMGAEIEDEQTVLVKERD